MAIKAGLYTTITSIDPAEAVPGSTVNVTVSIQNTTPGIYTVSASIFADGVILNVSPPLVIDAGETGVFTADHDMPDSTVTIEAESWVDWGEEFGWILDDTRSSQIEPVSTGDWIEVASTTLRISRYTAEWLEVASSVLNILRVPLVSEWLEVASTFLNVSSIPVVSGWIEVSSINITIGTTESVHGWIEVSSAFLSIVRSGASPYELVYSSKYPDADSYVGKAEVCPFTFAGLPEQIPGSQWLGELITQGLADSILEHGEGEEMLQVELWADYSDPLLTQYYAEATATASPVPWALIIGALAIIAVIVSLVILVNEVKTIDWGKAGVPLVLGAIAVIAVAGGVLLISQKKT